ncbi:MAG: hypothetical protein Q9M31_05930, partial [Mariprofundus sp.]|nr:hypothetical protein [Mariprofundus sp.]
MKRQELLELIANGENSGVEFKLDDIRPEQLAKEVVALANLRVTEIIKYPCGRARSSVLAGENPVPRRISHPSGSVAGSAGVIPKIKHRGNETIGRKL